ncbi:hypothetical protein CHL78_016330 [Romboutsia weinsteinii]|uniref:Uncharacterized protein n=1 Tax=Romboutsia weinsteinii TaxID=2020949 RepID=A0A371IZB8_9FIRM|nr:hypothetical protein [Romboutsia weinsteinii]RDY25816.1 hypothetical protein CHL78_016330 [Romboutsia weinsteinii]
MEFKFAKVTNSRLMGSMGLVIVYTDDKDSMYQYFLLDAEGLGISDYVGLKNPTKEECYREEERLMGGLGADRIRITKEEALFLVSYFGNKNSYYNKDLPGNVDEYVDIIKNNKSELSIEDIYPKICKEITTDVEFINYITMRFIAWDREALKYYSDSEEISNMHITNINGTLLKNKVTNRGNGRYISEALYEDNDGYYECKIAFNIDNTDGKFKVSSMLVADREPILDFEVFDEISKDEFVSIYNLSNREEFVERFYIDNPFMLKSDMEDAVFFTRFNFNNNHVKQDIYVINNDIKAIYYQIGEKFFVGTYSDRDRKYINKILQYNYKDYLQIEDELYFDENVLYDFVESGSNDFDDFLE